MEALHCSFANQSVVYMLWLSKFWSHEMTWNWSIQWSPANCGSKPLLNSLTGISSKAFHWRAYCWLVMERLEKTWKNMSSNYKELARWWSTRTAVALLYMSGIKTYKLTLITAFACYCKNISNISKHWNAQDGTVSSVLFRVSAVTHRDATFINFMCLHQCLHRFLDRNN